MALISSVLIGSLSSNSETTVTGQTALSSSYCFQNNMAAENPLANKSSKKSRIEEIKAHIIPLKEKEAIYGVKLFPKDKSTFYMHAYKTIYLPI